MRQFLVVIALAVFATGGAPGCSKSKKCDQLEEKQKELGMELTSTLRQVAIERVKQCKDGTLSDSAINCVLKAETLGQAGNCEL